VIRLATRGSDLALRQVALVKAAIERAHPDESVEIVTVRTRGDDVQDREIAAIGGVNVFTAEVDRAVSDGRADAGIHSLKDLGTRLAEGIAFAATLERGPVEDVLVAPKFGRLRDLPRGARVGTGSPRRRAMVLRERPDLVCVGLRGNVETRIGKVERGEVDAAVLARAGIERLGLSRVITEILEQDRFLPAAGQGLIGITCRAQDARMLARLASIRDEKSFAAGVAERAALGALGAGCHAPVGALAVVTGTSLVLRCRILALDGTAEVAGSIEGAAGDAELLGRGLATELMSRGAAELLG
jgi:hydroxymethylbilane synthase